MRHQNGYPSAKDGRAQIADHESRGGYRSLEGTSGLASRLAKGQMAADYRRHRGEAKGQQRKDAEGHSPDRKSGQFLLGAGRNRRVGFGHCSTMTARRAGFADENRQKIPATGFL